MNVKRSNLISVGRLTGVFGIKGWIKVKSFTSPEENIFSYAPWYLKTRHGVKEVEFDAFEPRANGMIVHLAGIDDRDKAVAYTNIEIAVEKARLPALQQGDFYWHQLVGLEVLSDYAGNRAALGSVRSLLETGANDVLVVQATEHSIDNRERLIPYVPGVYVKHVDLQAGSIVVDWDPEF